MSHDTSAMPAELPTFPTYPEPALTAVLATENPVNQDEYENWHDRGCDIFPSCLHCPLPQCRHDYPLGIGSINREANARLCLELAAQGMTNDELARRFDCPKRTIQRYLSNPPS